MKITSSTSVSSAVPQATKPHRGNPQSPPPPLSSRPDLSKKTSHRKLFRRRIAVGSSRTPRKDAGSAAAGKRTGPATPLLRWKFDEAEGDERESVENVVVGDDDILPVEGAERRKARRGGTVSARKLAFELWRLQASEPERLFPRKVEEKLGFMHGISHVRLPSHRGNGGFSSVQMDQPRSPCSVNGPINGYICEPQPSLKFSNYEMEGVTKWDPACQISHNDPSNSKFLDDKLDAISKASVLQSELEKAHSRIADLESERRSSKKKLEHFLRKLSEERAAWRSREHEKVRAIIDGMKADLNRERKNRQRLEIVNSKLVNDLAEAKVVTKRYMQDYEKERKTRELVEEVCDELANEIGQDKAEIEALKKDCMTIREEADDERKMLQMAEVWREERVQMKLVDAKVTLEDKFSQMQGIIERLECFLRSKIRDLDPKEIKELEILQNAVTSVKVQDIKEFSYDPPKSDDIFSVFEEMAMAETSEKEIQPCYNPYGSENGEVDDDRSGWETVSHFNDHGSIYSCEESIMSINKGDESPVSGISEVCSVQSKQNKKASSISRLWRSGLSERYKIISVDGLKSRFSDGRISNGSSITSCGQIPLDLGSQCSSPENGMKGCIEWPRGQKTSLKSKLLEARMESQKVQLRQVLDQEM